MKEREQVNTEPRGCAANMGTGGDLWVTLFLLAMSGLVCLYPSLAKTPTQWLTIVLKKSNSSKQGELKLQTIKEAIIHHFGYKLDLNLNKLLFFSEPQLLHL
jgi:hypothetical protein